MAKNSDTNFFGITKYVVSQTGGGPYYSTIQSAINAASTAGRVDLLLQQVKVTLLLWYVQQQIQLGPLTPQ
jgi:hypothetical protein